MITKSLLQIIEQQESGKKKPKGKTNMLLQHILKLGASLQSSLTNIPFGLLEKLVREMKGNILFV